MSNTDQAAEPTMDEILASIRRIIADEPVAEAAESDDDVLDLSDDLISTAPHPPMPLAGGEPAHGDDVLDLGSLDQHGHPPQTPDPTYGTQVPQAPNDALAEALSTDVPLQLEDVANAQVTQMPLNFSGDADLAPRDQAMNAFEAGAEMPPPPPAEHAHHDAYPDAEPSVIPALHDQHFAHAPHEAEPLQQQFPDDVTEGVAASLLSNLEAGLANAEAAEISSPPQDSLAAALAQEAPAAAQMDDPLAGFPDILTGQAEQQEADNIPSPQDAIAAAMSESADMPDDSGLEGETAQTGDDQLPNLPGELPSSLLKGAVMAQLTPGNHGVSEELEEQAALEGDIAGAEELEAALPPSPSSDTLEQQPDPDAATEAAPSRFDESQAPLDQPTHDIADNAIAAIDEQAEPLPIEETPSLEHIEADIDAMAAPASVEPPEVPLEMAQPAEEALPEPQAAAPAADGPKTLEQSIQELLKPMLREWLDDNMPRIVEGVVKNEMNNKN